MLSTGTTTVRFLVPRVRVELMFKKRGKDENASLQSKQSLKSPGGRKVEVGLTTPPEYPSF